MPSERDYQAWYMEALHQARPRWLSYCDIEEYIVQADKDSKSSFNPLRAEIFILVPMSLLTFSLEQQGWVEESKQSYPPPTSEFVHFEEHERHGYLGDECNYVRLTEGGIRERAERIQHEEGLEGTFAPQPI